MGENRLKEQSGDPGSRDGKTFFNIVDEKLSMGKVFENGLPVKYIPYILYVTFLGVIYIGTTHYSDRLNTTLIRLHKEVEDLRSDYTTLKSDYMYESKQSEVSKKVRSRGLIEDKNPPRKIVVE